MSRREGGFVAVQRVTPRATALDPNASQGAAATAGFNSLEEMARAVYATLRRRFMVERERAGTGSSWY